MPITFVTVSHITYVISHLISHLSTFLCSALPCLQAPSLSLVLLNLEEAKNKTREGDERNATQVVADGSYSAMAFELAALRVRGVLGSSQEDPILTAPPAETNVSAPGRSLSVSLDVSLYLFLSETGREVVAPQSAVLCASFPVRINVSKTGSDPTSMTSSISMADFASTLSVAPSSMAMQLLMNCESHRQKALSILSGFLQNVRNAIPSILPFQADGATASGDSLALPGSEPSASPAVVSDDVEVTAKSLPSSSSTGTLLQDLRPIDSSTAQEPILEYVTAYGTPAKSQRLITSQISRSLQSVHRNLEQLHLNSILPSQSASKAIEEAILVCGELQETALKLRHAALVTVSMTPSYCGWVYRSSGFLVNPLRVTGRRRSVHGKDSIGGTGWGVKSWMVLVMGNLLFMSQPYAGSVDLSLSLDDIIIADPDESEIATMSMPAAPGPTEKVVRHTTVSDIGHYTFLNDFIHFMSYL
jgi:hypothetical protein